MERPPTRPPLRKAERWALVALFLLAFLPRAIYPVSRPLQWYFRSAQFFQAAMEGDWAGTLFSEHPGVTVMWLSGGALWGWYGLQTLVGLSPPTPLETEGYAFADRVAVGVLPLAVVISVGIVWGWFLLRRLFDSQVAWTATILWAIDPFHLTNSKVLHLDAVLSVLMMLSALWMLIHLRDHETRALVYSAVLGGLALLTKIAALFLIPFLGLCLLVAGGLSLRASQPAPRVLRSLLLRFLLWLLIAFTLYVLLWPAMWSQPLTTLETVVQQGIVRKINRAHALPRFHRGRTMIGDPGTLYYIDTLLFRTTFLTLPFFFVGIGAAMRKRGRTPWFLLVAFAVFYLAQMTLASRKESRYLLPVFLAIDVFSARGIVWWARRVGRRRFPRPLHLIGLLLLAQALAVLPRFPYYGTLYNRLLGGPRTAQRVLPLGYFGEGLDLAGRYIDDQPEAEHLTVATQFLANEILAQYVRAPVYDIAAVGEDADFLVFGVQFTTRGRDFPRWGALWETTYKFREAEFTVSFDGIPYAWVHRPAAEPVIPHPMDVRLGEPIRLAGYRLAQDEVSPGDPLLLTLYWRADGPIEQDYTVFVHLQGPDGRLVAQQDHPPVGGTRPTSGWGRGDLVEDPYEVPLPSHLPPGEYLLSVGMYDPTNLERLPAFSADGERLPEDRIVLATVRVVPVVPFWHRALSIAWLALIAAGVGVPWLRKRG
ncbi:MAG TPA: phospholipid carrier-dependent glycosyltransferase [Chloroflexi bacterium]|nr:phospholipid carrier-dependent glycosyltransferase [Chloroflexota bacterium]